MKLMEFFEEESKDMTHEKGVSFYLLNEIVTQLKIAGIKMNELEEWKLERDDVFSGHNSNTINYTYNYLSNSEKLITNEIKSLLNEIYSTIIKFKNDVNRFEILKNIIDEKIEKLDKNK